MRWAGRLLWGTGEALVTLGVVALLLAGHQLWWTNLQARESARREVRELERLWDAAPEAQAASPAGASGAVEEGAAGEAPDTSDESDGTSGSRREDAYAVLRIPRLGVTVPVAQGTGRAAVLDRGYVGHYPRTAQPGQAGNFAVAGHRNTHGEPFRRLDRLRAGDTVVVETAGARFTYVVAETVPRTSASDSTVLEPVPYSSVHPAERMSGSGHYLTMTTCTPEYTSEYRLVVWGRLASAEPR